MGRVSLPRKAWLTSAKGAVYTEIGVTLNFILQPAPLVFENMFDDRWYENIDFVSAAV